MPARDNVIQSNLATIGVLTNYNICIFFKIPELRFRDQVFVTCKNYVETKYGVNFATLILYSVTGLLYSDNILVELFKLL